MFVKIAVILLLIFFFYQDMRFKAIYLVCFPLLLLLLLYLGIHDRGADSVFTDGMINSVFLIVQLLIITAYFSVKHRQITDVTEHYLGWGDILFLAVIAFYLSPLNYITFYVCSLLVVLFMVFMTGVRPDRKIPLAGLQAILFGVLLMADWSSSAIDLTADGWLNDFVN